MFYKVKSNFSMLQIFNNFFAFKIFILLFAILSASAG